MIVEGTAISNYADTELCYAQLARKLRRPVTTDVLMRHPHHPLHSKTGRSRLIVALAYVTTITMHWSWR